MFVVPNQYYNKYVIHTIKFSQATGRITWFKLTNILQTKSTCTIRFSTQFSTQPCHTTYRYTKRTNGWSCAGT